MPFQAKEATTRTEEHGRTFPPRLYAIQSLGSSAAHDGTMMQVRTYIESTGAIVSVTHGTFRSPRLSTDELHYLVNDATKIVQQGPKRGRFGNTIGERVVVVFSGKMASPDTTVVAWTAGRDFYRVTSHSAQAALNMESRQ